MDVPKKLPKFRRPPLIEVVHGVQFRQLPMTIAHPGLFYLRVRDRYPQTQTVVALPPTRETFDDSPMLLHLGFVGQDEIPRAWFVSNDDATLIQLQRDRLLLNWRRGAQSAEYPHFEAVSDEFQRIYADLEAFAAENNLGEVQPTQCEVTYVNHLHAPAARGDRPDPASIIRLLNAQVGPEWQLPIDDLSFTARYLLPGEGGRPIGRLTATLATLISSGGGEAVLQLDITARGSPEGTGLDAVVAFHNMAHKHIVHCFTGITTRAAHEKWDRWQ
jgi:uncharacterized protein (TIGR04255 family)